MIQSLAAPAGVAGYWLWLVIAVAAVLLLTKSLGAMFARIGQSASLGEMLAGVILGASVLGVLDPRDPIIHALSQAGILVLLFSAGLHTEPSALLRPASGARAVATAGAVVPFVLGVVATYAFGATWIESLVAGAAMAATSIYVSVRTLGELGMLEAEEGRIVQSAAIVADVMSLAIVAVVMGLVTSTASTVELIVRSLLVPSAFVAGLLIDAKGMSGRVSGITSRLYWVMAPFFFAVTGASLDVRGIMSGRALALTAMLIGLGVLGKLAAGWAPRRFEGNRLLVGVAMVPRGAMGLIFAQLGLASGAIEGALYAAIVLLVVATSVITPPLLRAVARPQPQVA